jgi:ABC-type nitrate/sulfonate/bicarbonate transport system substrate-binding protein
MSRSVISRTMCALKLAALAALAAVVIVAGGPVAAQQGKRVIVGVAPSSDTALLIIAVNGGFLKKQGVDAQLKVFDSSPQALQALVAQQADISMQTEPPQLATRAKGGKVVQVMTGWISGRNAAGVVAGKVIARPEDFIGKTVATQRGSGSNYHMVTFLANHHIPLDKVTIKFMAAPDQIPALARSDIQAFFCWEPYVSRAEGSIPDAKILTWAQDDGIEFRDNVVMREDFAKGDKETAVRVVKGLIATAEWMQGNLNEAAKMANVVLRAPTEQDVYHDLQIFKYLGDFRKSMIEHERRMAEWAISMGLFEASDPQKLVQELIYPDIIKAAAPDRTDM